jgi:catechol-2,3-dioxygenase
MIGRLDNVIFDVPDVPRLTEFYRDLTGWSVAGSDGEWATLKLPDGRQMSLQAAPDHVPPRWPDPDYPQQLHLDLLTADIEAASDRAVELGATRLGKTEEGESSWVTLSDPAGHPFCLCHRDGHGDGISGPMGLYGVCIDTEDPGGLGSFYAELLGMPLSWEGDEGALLGGEGGAVYFQRVQRHVRPQWPDAAHPQQGHVDVWVEDIEQAQQQALAIGATPLPGGGAEFRVYADPSGHPFCLIF